MLFHFPVVPVDARHTFLLPDVSDEGLPVSLGAGGGFLFVAKGFV